MRRTVRTYPAFPQAKIPASILPPGLNFKAAPRPEVSVFQKKRAYLRAALKIPPVHMSDKFTLRVQLVYLVRKNEFGVYHLVFLETQYRRLRINAKQIKIM